MDRSTLYNKSIREAYENMVMGTAGTRHINPDQAQYKLRASSASILHENKKQEEPEFSELSDNELIDGYGDDSEVDVKDKQDAGTLEADNDYTQFKKSLIQDDEWLDDESDTDYTEEADQSFLMENDDDSFLCSSSTSNCGFEDDPSSKCPDSEFYFEDSVRTNNGKWYNNKIYLLITGSLIVWFLASWLFVHGSSPLTPDLNKRINTLQNQLNQLNHERDLQKNKYQSDLDQNIKVIIQQFERNVKKLLPKNVKDFSLVHSSIEKLENRVDTLSEKVAWKNVNETLSRLSKILPSEIPVIINSDHSSEGNVSNRQVLLIPELHQYLIELIPPLINNSLDIQSIFTNADFKYDLNHYVKEILSNELQYIDRSQFIQELHSNIHTMREDLSKEIESKTSQLQTPQQISTVILKKMIHRIYNSNQHQLETNLNKVTFAQGAKILNHLCTKTVKGATNPIDLLEDCSFGCSTSTYWLCQSKGCQWAIRFDEPLFLTKISYLHGRFSHNLEVMAGSPKMIAIYVKPLVPISNADHIKKWTVDSTYIELGRFHYDLFSNAIKQDFLLPDWFIQSKTLVRSMIFVVDENHGNPTYTAMRKFIVNGVTPKDLQLMNSFPSDWSQMAPEYSISVEEQERTRLSKIAKWQDQQVPSFGEDELID
ncbi:unnamed protein product [Kluyveromyces dobzhanskii CBS 2104]|uniref:WGS project CCBQ000000000 data, contig 00058 n=1 Tax=Kluyveromyces dobzhanskii CBS 2104 TaxID=1427455 RepID=A0A0A8LDI8_9SACH|nr:unnamed protein product [Kluyveromyces dobzhanskii CBS 2104]